MTTDLKIITKNERLTEVKKGNKIIFSILKSRPKKDGLITFNSFDKTMLGIVSDRKSFDECLNDTFNKLNIMNEDFKTRLISI
jgi:hypothetical protein